MGGSVALIYAACAEHRLEHLMIVEGLGPPVEDTSQSIKRLKQHLAQRHTTAQHQPFQSIDVAVQRYLKHHPYLSIKRAQTLVERSLIKHEEDWYWSWDPRHRHRAAFSLSEQTRVALIEQINTPTDVILCTNSAYGRIPQLHNRVNRFPQLNGVHHIASGHSPHLETPAILSEILINTLEAR